jgi:hypothetical protein
MKQTLSFHLPSNSGVASVITPAIQKEVLAAAVGAITLASGQAPSNMTIVPTFSTSNSDGSITILFLIEATLSKIVNTTISINAAAYSADPTGSTATAIKSSKGGIIVQGIAVSLTAVARQAAASVCALVNASATTTLVSRIATVIQINASSIIATGVCAVDSTIISDAYGVITVVDGGSDKAGGTTTAGLSLTEILQSGGVAGLIAACIALFIMYLLARRKVKNSNNSNITTSRGAGIKSTSTFSTLNPLKTTTTPKPPKSNPPKHAFTSFQHTHTENNPGSVNSSDSSLKLATTINPLRKGQSSSKR